MKHHWTGLTRRVSELACTAAARYAPAMTQRAPPIHDQATEADPKGRLAREAEEIAEARAELDAGLYVDADDIGAWIDSLATNHELPPPPTRHR